MKWWGFGTGLAGLLLASPAWADNSESFFYSDDAAMTAGAVSAMTRDAGAIWYQPAGLGGIKRGQIDLSGSAFGVRIRNVPNALATTFPSGRAPLDVASSDIFSAPHAVGLVRHVTDSVSLGAGLFVTYRDVRTAENEAQVVGPALGDPTTNGQYRERLDVVVDQTRYHFGPAIGIELAEGLRIGASLFGTYAKENGFLQFLIGQQAQLAGGSSTFLVLGQSRLAFSYFGMQAQAGVQWEPASDVGLSLLVRSPEVLLTESTNGAVLQSTTLVVPNNPPTASFTLQKPAVDIGAGTVVSPMRVVVGVGKRWGDRTWLSAEVDLQLPFKNDFDERETVVNGRVGARFRLTEKLSLGGGLYTDRSGKPDVGGTFGDERVHEYGATFGVELRTPLSLADKPDPDALVLSTTLALKYGLGIGSFRAQDVDLTSTNPAPPRTVDVTYHVIVPYIGSSILF